MPTRSFWKEGFISPGALECCWQIAVCCQPFSGIALAGKSWLAQCHVPFLDNSQPITEWYEKEAYKGLVPSPQMGMTQQGHRSPPSPLAKPCSVSLPQAVIPRTLPLKLITVLHCSCHLRTCFSGNLICNNMKTFFKNIFLSNFLFFFF